MNPLCDRALGLSMTAYFGGRAEVRIRRVPVPVRYVDFTSMYVTSFSLLNLWPWLTAERFAERDATEEARDYLNTISREQLFNPSAWTALSCVFCRLRPDGDVLPVR